MEDRALGEMAATLAALRAKVEDLESTGNARAHQRPTGTVDMVLRNTEAPGTLFLNGQTVSRVLHLRLWAYVQEQGLVLPGVFTVGDGSTTFGLPDWRGRTPVGVQPGGDIAALGAEVGAALRTLTVANMPSHDHNVSAVAIGNHGHQFETSAAGGNHGGHFPANSFLAAAGSDLGLASWNGVGATGNVAHSHSGGVELSGNHTHTINESAVGSGTAFDNRPPLKACHYAIWT